MKKIYLIILSLLMLIIPTIIKADMAAPTLTTYKMIVTNPNGIKIDEKLTIPYGTEVYAQTPHILQGTKYFIIIYNEKSYNVKIEDLQLVSNSLDDKEFSKNNTKKYIYKEGAYLYKGPSTLFEKVDGNIEIPIGTIVNSSYEDDLWCYVTYNGINGWLHNKSGGASLDKNIVDAVLDINDKNSYYIKYYYPIKNIKLSSTVGKEIEIGDTIDAFTKLDYEYLLVDGSNEVGNYIYTNYNGTKGYISTKNLSYEYNKDYYIFEDLKIYSNIDKQSAVGNILKNSEVKVLYSVIEDDWDYIEYENQKFWTDFKSNRWYEDHEVGFYERIDCAEEKNIEFVLLKDSNIYENINGKAKENKLKKGIINVKYIETKCTNIETCETWYYVKDKDNNGWIKKDENIKRATDKDVIVPGKTKYTLKNNARIYEGFQGKVTEKTISPKEVTIMEVEEDENFNWWKINDGQTEGWIALTKSLRPITITNEKNKYEYYFDERTMLYSTIEGIEYKNLKEGTFTVEKTARTVYEVWLYGTIDNYTGWLKPDLISYEIYLNKKEAQEKVEYTEYETEEKTSILVVLIIGIIIAVIVDLCFVISMKYIKKKKDIKPKLENAEQSKEQDAKESKEQK